MNWYADYENLPYMPECAECGDVLDEDGDCLTCIEADREEAA